MSLCFCMLEGANGSQVAINPNSVVAVRADGGRVIVVHTGGEIAVRGGVGEIALKLIVTAGQPPLGSELKAAA